MSGDLGEGLEAWELEEGTVGIMGGRLMNRNLQVVGVKLDI